jgi:hypothetical protein
VYDLSRKHSLQGVHKAELSSSSKGAAKGFVVNLLANIGENELCCEFAS